MPNMLDKETFRLGLIVADKPIDIVVQESGEYPTIFQTFLTASLKSLEAELSRPLPRLELISYKAFGEDRQLPTRDNNDHIDGYMITGSAFCAYEGLAWIDELLEFVTHLLTEEFGPKLVGVCFGHQILARALVDGSVVRNSLGWEDHVISVPKGYFNLGSTSTSPIQGLYREGRALSLQGHPEFTNSIAAKVCARRTKLGVFTPDQYEEILSRLDQPHDGIRFGVCFWKFYLGILPKVSMVEVHD
ncbi:hypothetical protein L0F63_000838 [Massospora cicadina]|nr:hypothetical protein L0F63_000838 [Massospora cicadina]